MSGRPDFALVADDLTGAMDSGAKLALSGRRTAVLFEGESGGSGSLDGLAAVVFDTDSRSASPEEARGRVLEAGRHARSAVVAYKKIDSTLRGNVAVETAALMDATGLGRAVVAPAFPRAGRTTVGGTQLMRGVPVHETGFARDPRTPVLDSRLPKILSGLGEVRCLAVEYLDDESGVRRAVEESRVVVADATEESHLIALVRAVPDPSRVLWVGSAGLAEALADVLAPGGSSARSREPSVPPCRGGVLVVVGSLSEVSREQLRRLARSGAFVASVGDGYDERGARQALRSGGCAALHSPSKVVGIPAEEISGMLAETAAGLEGCFGSLVMTGGDTALAVCRRLGATGVEVFGEVEPGVPFGKLVGRSPLPVVTKAGGFGEPDALCDAARFLSGDSVERGVKG